MPSVVLDNERFEFVFSDSVKMQLCEGTLRDLQLCALISGLYNPGEPNQFHQFLS